MVHIGKSENCQEKILKCREEKETEIRVEGVKVREKFGEDRLVFVIWGQKATFFPFSRRM